MKNLGLFAVKPKKLPVKRKLAHRPQVLQKVTAKIRRTY